MVTYTIYDCLEKLTVILFPESQIILLVKKKKKKKINGLWNQFPKVNDDSNFIINYKILKPFFNSIACPELSEKSQLINNFGKRMNFSID